MTRQDITTTTRTSTTTTILAYGALLSETSSRLTFPYLNNFRHVRVKRLRRVFGHPHLFLLQQKLITDESMQRLELASLSAETVPSSSSSSSSTTTLSFVVAAFDVEMDQAQWEAFEEREASYKITTVPYYQLPNDKDENVNDEPLGSGVICLAWQDAAQSASLLTAVSKLNLPYPGIWNWPMDSGLLPAHMYLRHVLLAVEKGANDPNTTDKGAVAALKSFWNDTYLADRTTTLAEYLSNQAVYQRVMASQPPPELATRFGG